MPVLRLLTNRFLKELTSLSWLFVASSLTIYLSFSYIGLFLTGEEALVSSLVQFLYFMAVTGSTVGFGDYAPVTPYGKLFTAYFVVPFGVAIFAFLIGKVSSDVIGICAKRLHGLHSLMQKHHIVIIGYNTYTASLIEQIRKEAGANVPIALCVSHRGPEQNPFIEQGVEYFRAETLSDECLYERASVSNADKVLIDLEDDGETNLVCMHLSAITSDTTRITAYVKNPMVGRLLEAHCPKINVIPSLHQKMLVKAAMDPGSEEVMRKLVDANHGQTQYATQLPSGARNICVEDLASQLRKKGRASLMAIKQSGDEYPMLNPDYDTKVSSGDVIYYIAKARLTNEEILSCCQ